MSSDNWSDYKAFKSDDARRAAYYDLVRCVFEAGVVEVSDGRQFARAIDLGCGSGDLTRGLLTHAKQVTGVDSSPGLIGQARANSDPGALDFLLADVLDADAMAQLPQSAYSLLTAAWLHNHLHSEDNQRQLLDSILKLLRADGRIVFLIPGDAFTTPRSQRFIASLDWHQAWLEEGPGYNRGVYRFADAPWQEMTVWQPMWLARLYAPYFDLRFLDVKSLSLAHGGLGDAAIEPPFELMIGRRRVQANK